MIESESNVQASIFHQVAAVIVTMLVFVVIWLLAAFLLRGFDYIRGLGNDWLQAAFRDIFAPFVGGYAGILAALSWLKRSTAKFVFCSFAVIILLTVGAYLGFVGMHRVQANITISSFLWGAATLAASIFGAYKAASDRGFKL